MACFIPSCPTRPPRNRSKQYVRRTRNTNFRSATATVGQLQTVGIHRVTPSVGHTRFSNVEVVPVFFEQLPTYVAQSLWVVVTHVSNQFSVCRNWFFDKFRLFNVRLDDSNRFTLAADDRKWSPGAVLDVSNGRNRLQW